ncbi:MAG: BlaI/MecI/CopY family transcriptional regulator [Saprospiraceae bacterium]|nr:BlaI/MecI/CopY family transcriptional regulator [Saprospiraceae bacterium]
MKRSKRALSPDAGYQPTEAELEILNLVWELQPVSVRDIHARIAETRPVGYTTVLKQVQRLVEKGVLERSVVDGAHYFSSTLQQSAVQQQLVDRIVQTAFGGSALEMMMQALGRDKVSEQELRAIKNWLDQQF